MAPVPEKMVIRIRPEEGTDRLKVNGINRAAFGRDGEADLVDKIRKGGNFVPSLSLVAEMNGEVVGHVLFSRIWIVEDHSGPGNARFETLALAPLAVAPGYQKKGVGGRLIGQGLAAAKELGFSSVIVLGHSGYFPRFGFQRASKWGIKCPFEVPDEVFLA